MENGKQVAEWFRARFEALRAEIARVIVGQEEVVENVLVAVAAGGHRYWKVCLGWAKHCWCARLPSRSICSLRVSSSRRT